jgi:putative Ca2+/H+ antiporter (TMEM165/GDT1 family)
MEDHHAPQGGSSVFLVTLLTFFLAEMGDKTQVATVMLAAKYHTLAMVVAGTTLGMMVADVPAVLLGKIAAPKIPFKLVRLIAAVLFALLGIGVLLGFGSFA